MDGGTLTWAYARPQMQRAHEVCFGVWARGDGWKLAASDIATVDSSISARELQAKSNRSERGCPGCRVAGWNVRRLGARQAAA
eukprot:7683766-Pyramimonas_sp.AAC.1